MKVFNDIYIQAITGSGCYTCQRINRSVTLKKGIQRYCFLSEENKVSDLLLTLQS